MALPYEMLDLLPEDLPVRDPDLLKDALMRQKIAEGEIAAMQPQAELAAEYFKGIPNATGLGAFGSAMKSNKGRRMLEELLPQHREQQRALAKATGQVEGANVDKEDRDFAFDILKEDADNKRTAQRLAAAGKESDAYKALNSSAVATWNRDKMAVETMRLLDETFDDRFSQPLQALTEFNLGKWANESVLKMKEGDWTKFLEYLQSEGKEKKIGNINEIVANVANWRAEWLRVYTLKERHANFGAALSKHEEASWQAMEALTLGQAPKEMRRRVEQLTRAADETLREELQSQYARSKGRSSADSDSIASIMEGLYSFGEEDPMNIVSPERLQTRYGNTPIGGVRYGRRQLEALRKFPPELRPDAEAEVLEIMKLRYTDPEEFKRRMKALEKSAEGFTK